MSNQTFAPVNVTITPQRGGNERGSNAEPEEQKDPMTSLAATVSSLFQAVQQMQQSMAQQSQRMAELTQREGFQTGAAHRPSSQTADTLPTPVSAFRHAHFTAYAPKPHRLSYGMPALAESPGTPLPAEQAGAAAMSTPPRSEREGEAAGAPPQPVATTEREDRTALKDALGMASKRVESFYADSIKDKDNYSTVTSFVEKIETVMGDCYLPSHLRLTMVRWFLQEGALRWMNKKLAEMEAAADREGRDLARQPLSWDGDVRRAFIQAHMGTDTVELWLAKLSMLELDESKKGAARNPIELESQFDNIARHVYPYHVADDDRSELLLASKYSEIIRRSQPALYNHMVYSGQPLTSLKEWKEMLVRMWSARERINAAQTADSQPGQQQSGGSRGGYGGYNSNRARGQARGGYGGAAGRGAPNEAKQPTVNAIDTDIGARGEGQQPTEHGEVDQQQLGAVPNNRGGRGGGRGGRGRRGRGIGPMAQWTDEQKKRYAAGVCLTCGADDHYAANCPKAGATQ
jgi:hypothetical protein